MTHYSEFNGKVINPPNAGRYTTHYVVASDEERAFAVELDKQMPGEYAAIARRCVRKFGNQRGPTTVRNWIRASKV